MTDQNQDPLVQFEHFMRGMSRQDFAGLLYEYFLESNHQSWDGHPSRDKTAYRNLVRDIMTCHAAAIRDDPDYFTRPIFNGTNTY